MGLQRYHLIIEDHKIMKTLLTALSFIAIFIICLSCNNKKTGEDLVKRYIADSIFIDKEIYNIHISQLDSCYSGAYNDPSYQKIKRELTSRIYELKKDISNFELEKKVGHKSTSKEIIKNHQNYIRNGIQRLLDLQISYKSEFIGFSCAFHAKYKTNFSDSLLSGWCYLSPQKDRFLSQPIVFIGQSIDSPTSDLVLSANELGDMFIEEIAKDTTELFLSKL